MTLKKVLDQNPTTEFYQALQNAFEHFNTALFDGSLPNVMFSIHRQNNVMGYFSSRRWGDNKANSDLSEKTCDEIAINPDYVGRSAIIELFQTLVHEMAHQWQYCHGKPSKRAYHNKEWALKMIDIGLMPSTTGLIGGKTTGEKMSDYPMQGGLFLSECMVLLESKGFTVPWVDRRAITTAKDEEILASYSEFLPDTDTAILESLVSSVSSVFENVQLNGDIEELDQVAAKRLKSRYSCKSCNSNVWGKPNLNIGCWDCNKKMIENN